MTKKNNEKVQGWVLCSYQKKGQTTRELLVLVYDDSEKNQVQPTYWETNTEEIMLNVHVESGDCVE